MAAKAGLKVALSSTPLTVALDDAVEGVGDATGSLRVHRDAPGTVESLAAARFRLACLSNGPA